MTKFESGVVVYRQLAAVPHRLHGLLFFHADPTLHVIWIGDHRELLGRDLDRFAVERRKPIETKLTALHKDPNKNRRAGHHKHQTTIFPNIEPIHDLAVHLEQVRVWRRSV